MEEWVCCGVKLTAPFLSFGFVGLCIICGFGSCNVAVTNGMNVILVGGNRFLVP